jgi:hypothetical protein
MMAETRRTSVSNRSCWTCIANLAFSCLMIYTLHIHLMVNALPTQFMIH